MESREGVFAGPKGDVFHREWLPDGPARALLLVVHGAGEHSGRYAHVAEKFCQRGFVVAALDHPGHGRSAGRYGHLDRFDDYLATLHQYQQLLAPQFPGLPMVLLGHSMGGLISASYLLQHQQDFVACALSGPAITTELEPGPVQRTLVQLLSVLWPTLPALQLDASGVSRDPEVVAAYQADPLVHHGKMSARFVAELFAAMQQVQERAGEIRLPLLLMHGEADSLTAPAGSRLLHERAGSADKTLKLYPGLYHEIFNEPEQDEVLAELLAWCEQQLPAA